MILSVRAQGADAARGSRRGRKEGLRRGADWQGQAARERRRWPLRAKPEAARAAAGGAAPTGGPGASLGAGASARGARAGLGERERGVLGRAG